MYVHMYVHIDKHMCISVLYTLNLVLATIESLAQTSEKVHLSEAYMHPRTPDEFENGCSGTCIAILVPVGVHSYNLLLYTRVRCNLC